MSLALNFSRSLLFIGVTTALTSTGFQFDPSDFRVGLIVIGDPIDTVLVHLGSPGRIDTQSLAGRTLEPDTAFSFYYGGIEVEFEGQRHVRYVILTSSEFATARGIRVGDSTSTVQRLYGLPRSDSEPRGEYDPGPDSEWGYSERNSFLGIRFTCENGRVKKIFVGWGAC